MAAYREVRLIVDGVTVAVEREVGSVTFDDTDTHHIAWIFTPTYPTKE